MAWVKSRTFFCLCLFLSLSHTYTPKLPNVHIGRKVRGSSTKLRQAAPFYILTSRNPHGDNVTLFVITHHPVMVGRILCTLVKAEAAFYEVSTEAQTETHANSHSHNLTPHQIHCMYTWSHTRSIRALSHVQ